MKIIKSVLFLMILSFATTFSQPLLHPDRGDGNLQNDLNLTDSQKEKIEKILANKNDTLDKIRTRMMAIMDNLRDSTEYVSKETEEEILKIMDKEQAEKFKAETERHNQFAMMPPPDMRGNGFPQNMQEPNQFAPGFFGQCKPAPECMENQDDAPAPNFHDQDFPDNDEIDPLQDLDIFDLMNILE